MNRAVHGDMFPRQLRPCSRLLQLCGSRKQEHSRGTRTYFQQSQQISKM